jgi:hypothetical protein
MHISNAQVLQFNERLNEELRSRCYQCTAAEWKSWAENNYDFESVKACRGVPGVPGVPSDAETKELSQTFCYSNDMEMRQAATQRHFMNQAKHSRKPPKPLEAR